jgi:hypothetical protein
LLQIIGNRHFRDATESDGYFNAFVGVSPYRDGFVALDDRAITKVLNDLQDRKIGVRVLSVAGLQGRDLLQVIFFKISFPLMAANGVAGSPARL